MFWPILVGSVISFLLAFNMSEISDWCDGAGQELLFVFVLSSLSILILLSSLLMIQQNTVKSNSVKYVVLFSAIIVLVMSLEGAEIIIYFESSMSIPEQFKSSLLGGILGFGIGVSVGAASYYMLNQSKRFGKNICLALFSMVSAGMVSQAISYLMQAGIVEGGYPIWNTSDIVSEHSVLGQLLYALIGYESTPVLIQVIAYFLFLLIPLWMFLYLRTKNNNQDN